MKIRPVHAFNLSPDEALELQRELAGRLRSGPRPEPLRLVAGADAAYPGPGRAVGAAVVFDLAAGRIVDQAVAEVETGFPYRSGLLTFREAPALLAALARLEVEPDAVVFDGQGQAHPRRLGLAAHLGLFLEKPTIGCAKSRLFGRADQPGPERGSQADLIHPVLGQPIGRVVRTRTGVKPVFVSPGHLAEIDWACRLVLDLAVRYRLPEPLRAAHHLAGRAGVSRGRSRPG